MDKKIAGLLGAVATLGTGGAAPADVLRAGSYADLLEPIPNAATALRTIDKSSPARSAQDNVQLAQFYHHHHHHHHHHHSQYRRYAPRVVVMPPQYRRHHHHHHHHHHHSFYRRDY
jgi:hypothetical protein